jgi:hypothetical protein
MSFSQIFDYKSGNSLELADKKWRLPTIKELLSLLQFRRTGTTSIDNRFFSESMIRDWSANNKIDHAWIFDFDKPNFQIEKFYNAFYESDYGRKPVCVVLPNNNLIIC